MKALNLKNQSKSLPKTEEEQSWNSNKCKLCGGSTWVLQTGGWYARCKCYTVDNGKKQWEKAGLSIDSLDKTFKSFETTTEISRKMKDIITNYYIRYQEIKGNNRNSLALLGQPGCGKSHLTMALANNFIKKGIKVLYMPYVSVITALKQNITDAEYYKKEISKYQNCEILLIDDLFKKVEKNGKANDTDIRIMFEIINHRYLNKLPIIVSSEYSVENLLSFDEATASRLYEMAKDYIIEIKGQENNYRLRSD